MSQNKTLAALPLAILTLALPHAHAQAQAQFAPPPTTYSVLQANSMMGPTVTMQIWRDGNKAVIDLTSPAADGQKAHLVRTLYDLQAHKSMSWDPASPAGCGTGTFSGDWGDPFAGSAQMTDDLMKQHTKPTGTETINGVSAQVYEVEIPGGQGKAKAWVEPKYGLLMKAEMSMGGAPSRTIIEVKQFSTVKPPAALFVAPAACTAPANDPAHANDEHIKTITGGPASDFLMARDAPSTNGACSVLFRMVRAGSMTTVTSGYHIAIDKTVDPDHAPDYTAGVAKGKAIFGGGKIQDLTAQMQNGVLRIDGLGPFSHFEIINNEGNSGASTYLYRKCAGPVTTLLLVVKSPDELGAAADFLWVKSGKFAAH